MTNQVYPNYQAVQLPAASTPTWAKHFVDGIAPSEEQIIAGPILRTKIYDDGGFSTNPRAYYQLTGMGYSSVIGITAITETKFSCDPTDTAIIPMLISDGTKGIEFQSAGPDTVQLLGMATHSVTIIPGVYHKYRVTMKSIGGVYTVNLYIDNVLAITTNDVYPDSDNGIAFGIGQGLETECEMFTKHVAVNNTGAYTPVQVPDDVILGIALTGATRWGAREEVTDNLISLLRAKLNDPMASVRPSTSGNKNWIYPDFPRPTAYMPRVSVVRLPGSKTKERVSGNRLRLIGLMMQIDVWCHTDDECTINTHKYQGEKLLSYLCDQIDGILQEYRSYVTGGGIPRVSAIQITGPARPAPGDIELKIIRDAITIMVWRTQSRDYIDLHIKSWDESHTFITGTNVYALTNAMLPGGVVSIDKVVGTVAGVDYTFTSGLDYELWGYTNINWLGVTLPDNGTDFHVDYVISRS